MQQGTYTAEEVRSMFKWSETTLKRRYTGGDFPRPIRFEPGAKKKRFWDISEVTEYYERHKAQRNSGLVSA